MKLELRGIGKRFGSVIANENINLQVEPGKIYALLGENGAGKSTLMNVLYGLYKPDSGKILINDKPVTFNGPGDAVAAGIGMVHQHFMLVPIFTVAESVALGAEPMGSAGLIDLKQARQKVREVAKRFNFEIDPDALIENLSVGAQQRVEIIKALSREAKVLILDEPTAVLTPQETDELIGIMRQLANEGTSIIFITHKLREVKAIADEITVIRRGKVVGTALPSASENELANQMVGREVSLDITKAPPQLGDIALTVEHVSVLSDSNQVLLRDVNLTVQKGEVVAIAGVQGNGQTELAECLLGLIQPDRGKITLNGKNLTRMSVRKHLDADIGFVPEDRSNDGIVQAMSVAENLILDQYKSDKVAKGLVMYPAKIAANADTLVEAFDIRLGTHQDPISTLSGGNQQKVVVARELSKPLELLVVSQPTRGVDVGSIEFIHQQIVQKRDEGVPVVLVSSELDEVVQLGDRIIVMYDGRIIGDVPADTPRAALGLMMAGVPQQDALATTVEQTT